MPWGERALCVALQHDPGKPLDLVPHWLEPIYTATERRSSDPRIAPKAASGAQLVLDPMALRGDNRNLLCLQQDLIAIRPKRRNHRFGAPFRMGAPIAPMRQRELIPIRT